jgi:hypothetical protein
MSETTPEADLQDALEQTIGAGSFRVETLVALEGLDHPGEARYIAPDRFFQEVSGPGGAKSVMVGKRFFVTLSLRSDRYFLWRSKCRFSIELILPALRLVRHAKGVRLDGDRYVFRLADRGRGEARIENGKLTHLSLSHWLPLYRQRVEERYTFSDFGASLTIEPPPPSQIVQHSQFGDTPPLDPYTGSPLRCP